VIELFGATSRATRDHGDAVIPLLVFAAVLYLAITVPLGLIAGVIEKKVAVLR
jgi:glutamate transport system permease protein